MTDNQELKILILMAYYNRPILVKNALTSILKANDYYQNWELLFGDDGSAVPGKPIVEEILGRLTNKVKFVNSNLTLEEKLEHGISIGKFANQALKETDADIAFILCDDDELVPSYLFNLNRFFIENPEVLYAYSKIHLYNPLLQKSSDVQNISGKYNQYEGPINPVGKVDASQVAWRLSCCKQHGAWFAESTKHIDDKPWTKDTDRSFFENLFDCCGPCFSTGFVGQYKGIHDYQLLWHKNVQSHELQTYDKMCRDLAGRKF
jgi:glycosyltransferase involved in cell wall biosynthesis